MDESVQIRVVNSEKGKGLFALRDFNDGDVVFEEKPIISAQFSWNAAYGYAACDYCMKPLENAQENARRLTSKQDLILPYENCCDTKHETIVECSACGVKYCCSQCQNEAFQKYHRTLCVQSRQQETNHPLVLLNEMWKHIHYPPETATILLIVRILAYISQSEDKAAAIAELQQFCHRTVNDEHEIAHNLLKDKFADQIDGLREMTRTVVNNEYVAHWLTPQGFNSLLALVGTNGQGVGTSAFSRWVRNVTALEMPDAQRIHVDKMIDKIYDDMDEAVGTFLNNEGTGLYKVQSSMNHSCVPNVIIEFPHSNSTLAVKALRDIRAGEELCISYLDECELERSRHSRQKSLKSLYLFICQCEKCLSQADDPEETSSDEDDDLEGDD